MYEFLASFHKAQTDREGESKIIFTTPMSDLEVITKITREFAGSQKLLKITVQEYEGSN